jgi:GlcNAc-P-P-Und epimerase
MTNNLNISLLGGSGFLGSRLAKRFEKSHVNYHIYDKAPDSNNLKSSYLDVENVSTLDALDNYNLIINLAAEHKDNITPISRYDDVNVKGAANVCNAARKFNINKIIFTSSVAIYGFAPNNTGEEGSPNYFNDYGRTKYLAEQVYKKWQEEDPENRMLVIIRPTVIFGEGNRGNVFNLLNQIASKRFVMVGSGSNTKSMAYVENVAAFIQFSTAFNNGVHIYNYIDKPDLDMNKLVSSARKILFKKNGVGFRLPKIFAIVIGYIADLFSKITGLSLPISSIRVKKFLSTTSFSSSIVNDTSFIPPVNLEDGLHRTINYEFIDDNSFKKTFETE